MKYKGFASVLVTLVVVIAILAGIVWYTNSNSLGEEADITSLPEDVSRLDTESTQAEPDIAAATSGRYIAYSETDLASAEGNKVLFFHAAWCPTCKIAEKDILENAASIPADLTIYKVDYDTATDLKQRYKIPYQHTFVQVDSAGNEITKWSGGNLQDIIDHLKEA